MELSGQSSKSGRALRRLLEGDRVSSTRMTSPFSQPTRFKPSGVGDAAFIEAFVRPQACELSPSLNLSWAANTVQPREARRARGQHIVRPEALDRAEADLARAAYTPVESRSAQS